MQPAPSRYAIRFAYPGMDRFAWGLLAVMVVLIVKLVFGSLLALSLAGLVAERLRQQFVELDDRTLRLRIGYGPAIVVGYVEIEWAGEASGTGPAILRPRWLEEAAEVRLRRRKPLLVLTPFPLVWLSRRLRLPLADREAFIADLRERLSVDASAHSF